VARTLLKASCVVDATTAADKAGAARADAKNVGYTKLETVDAQATALLLAKIANDNALASLADAKHAHNKLVHAMATVLLAATSADSKAVDRIPDDEAVAALVTAL
jgi:hypothetical protein